MAETGFVNPYWETVAKAAPRLNDQVYISRHVVRKKIWHVIENRLTGRQVRITPEAYCFIGLLDGDRTVEKAMGDTARIIGDTAPGQSDVLKLLSQMHAAGLMSNAGQVTRGSALHERAEKMRRQRILQQLRSPLAIRIPLIDPDRMLRALAPLGSFLFSKLGAIVWLIMAGSGTAFALVHWTELSSGFLDRVFAAENVIVMGVVFAVMKFLHEMGHGLAVKRWGGDVHELGIMFLVFVPVPYVDATAANRFPSRFQRIAVSAAGMYVEMFLAAAAILLWGQTEQGLFKAALFNAALVGSVSTLLFNLNPLLKFDGYYIFSDLVELPNLSMRGSGYMRYLAERYILRMKDSSTLEESGRDKSWLLGYAVSSAVYRLFIVLAIALFVSQKFFFVGVLLAAWAVAQMLIMPIAKIAIFLVSSPKLRRRRTAAWAGALCAAAIACGLLFLVPAPRTSYTQGVVWVPENGEIVAGADGFVDAITLAEGAQVSQGDMLVKGSNMALDTERQRLLARREALEARFRAESVTDRVAAGVTRMEHEQTERRLAWVDGRREQLTVHAQASGLFSLGVPEDMLGRYVKRGQLLGFVISPEQATVRVAVSQRDIGLVREGVNRIEIATSGGTPVEALIVREIPQASSQLPSMALSIMGGGQFETISDSQGVRAVEELFHVELRAVNPGFGYRVGQKVHVKFVHSWEPVGFQTWRRMRQLFLRNLNV